LRNALIAILRGTPRLAVVIRSHVCLTLGGVLLTLPDIELRTVGFAIVPIVGTLMALVQHVIERVAVAEQIFAVQIELTVLDGDPFVAALFFRLALVVC
jgi:hypothetical protein